MILIRPRLNSGGTKGVAEDLGRRVGRFVMREVLIEVMVELNGQAQKRKSLA